MAEFKESEGLRERRKGSTNPTVSVVSSSNSADNRIEEIIHVNTTAMDKEKSILEKLFSTREEKKFIIPHIHKILGLSCLGSFAYRFAHLGKSDGGFGPHYGTLFFVFHHWLLNVSSFIFVLPKRRIRDGGYRIWPEYRIHSLVFASRNLAFMLLRWYEQKNGYYPWQYLWQMDILIVLATCALADFGSYIQGENHSDTVRGATFSDPFEQWFASQMQIGLTAFCLVGYRRYTVHFLALFVIQVNAFLMTLRRKNVASQYFLTGCYSILLLFSIVVISLDDQYTYRTSVAATFGGVATILRMGPLRVNKYILWSGLGLIWWYIRTTEVLSFHNSMFWLKGFCITSLVSTLLGWHKRSQAPPETRSSVVGYLVFASHFLLYSYIYIINYVWRWY